MALSVSEFRDFAHLNPDDETDSFLQGFVNSARDFCFRSAGITTEPTDPDDLNQFKLAVYTKGLALYSERDFPRPGVMDAVDKSVIQQLSGISDYNNTFIFTDPTGGTA